jgi:hypothetical protein
MVDEFRSRHLLRSLPHPYSKGSNSTKYLHDPRPAYAEMAGERRPILEPARVETCLVVAGEFERIAGFFRSRFGLRFGVRKSIPGDDGDDSHST